VCIPSAGLALWQLDLLRMPEMARPSSISTCCKAFTVKACTLRHIWKRYRYSQVWIASVHIATQEPIQETSGQPAVSAAELALCFECSCYVRFSANHFVLGSSIPYLTAQI
jgi:hypothetical protein